MPRHNQDSFPDLIFQVLKKQPWWVGPIVIVGTFVALRFLFPDLIDVPKPQFDSSSPEKGVNFGLQIMQQATADFSRKAAPWVTGFFTFIWLVALAAKYLERKTR